MKTLMHAFMLILISVGAVLLPGLSSAQTIRRMGALPPTETIDPPAILPGATPAASVDLTAWTVPVGDQKDVGSCTTWAIGYHMMGWYAKYLGMPQSETVFAPMYIYTQINGGADNGSSPTAAMNLLLNQGVDLASDYPQTIVAPYSWPYYPFYDWKDQPTAAEKANAAKYKIGKWHTLFSNASGSGAGAAGQAAIQNALTNTQPVAITIAVRSGFMSATQANDLITDTTSSILGYHEVFAVGYDQDGLLIQNSWGTGWGNAGFGRLSWAVVQKDVLQADVIDQAFDANPPPVGNYIVTATAGTGGTISPSGDTSVASGKTLSFKLTPNSGYKVASVGGCGGTWDGSNSYTTGAITANCTVAATFTQLTGTTYIVSASAGSGGTINPSGKVSVASGNTQKFTLAPNSGYKTSSVDGTCGGTWDGSNSYTTNAISGDCTVTVAFTPVTPTTTYTISATAGPGGSISPSGNVSVNSGSTQKFTFTPNPGYKVVSASGSSATFCKGGVFNYVGNGIYAYTVGPITADCAFTANFAPTTGGTYNVTLSANTGGTVNPGPGSYSVASGMNKTFAITPGPKVRRIVSGGTCGGKFSGSWPNVAFTTNPVKNNCSVTVTFQ